jgi:hypothetical protein
MDSNRAGFICRFLLYPMYFSFPKNLKGGRLHEAHVPFFDPPGQCKRFHSCHLYCDIILPRYYSRVVASLLSGTVGECPIPLHCMHLYMKRVWWKNRQFDR